MLTFLVVKCNAQMHMVNPFVGFVDGLGACGLCMLQQTDTCRALVNPGPAKLQELDNSRNRSYRPVVGVSSAKCVTKVPISA